jgi:hypothetical protein
LGSSESGSGLVFLRAFRICFTSLRETKSGEEGFRAKAQSGIESRKGESGHYGANSVLMNSLLTLKNDPRVTRNSGEQQRFRFVCFVDRLISTANNSPLVS